MDFVNLIVGALSQLCHCVANHTSYIRELQENLDSLRNAMRALNDMKTDVKRRIESAEVQQLRPRQQVQSWIQSVEEMEGQVNELLEQGSQQISNRCLGGCCPKNSCSSYKIGKKVIEKLTTVEELRSTGNFNDVADLLPPANVEAMPSTPTVGMDLMFENVWRCLIEEDQVRIIGLYGMGGVGKTTLLTKINDEFLRQGASDSGMVIFVTVSKESNVMRVQKDIGERVGLSFPEDASQDARAARIFNALSKKKIILLLDDIWDRVDFKAVGIPSPDIKNKSKIIFTTRSEAVCGLMEAQKKIKVECLRPDEAWDLFQKMVGEEALNSHPDIPKLAKIVAKECAGLPLSISTIGRAMASRKTPQEWTHAITVLKKSASEFLDMKFLKDLCLSHCSDLEEMVAGEGEKGFSLSLEKLYLANLPKLKRVRAVAHHPCFQNLLSLHIESCDALKNLTWLLNVGKLQKLHIANCKGIEEIIWGDVSAEEEITTFSRLKTVMLISLPKLRSIYGYALPFPSLKMIEVNECPELKKLPLDSNSAKNTLRRIRGEAVVGQVRMGG